MVPLPQRPRDVSWSQTLGSAALTAFIVQALTGGILAMYYEPSAAIDPVTKQPVAYSSIEAITSTLAPLVTMFSIWESWFGISSSAYCRSVL